VSISKWAGIHPYVSARVKLILDTADRYGGRYSILSGVRTAAKQFELWNRPGRLTPTAFPGCSQHQFGLAMDVQFQNKAWQDWYGASARNIGLTTVSLDPNHVQAVPGSRFQSVAAAVGVCPDPFYQQVAATLENVLTANFINTRLAGQR